MLSSHAATGNKASCCAFLGDEITERFSESLVAMRQSLNWPYCPAPERERITRHHPERAAISHGVIDMIAEITDVI